MSDLTIFHDTVALASEPYNMIRILLFFFGCAFALFGGRVINKGDPYGSILMLIGGMLIGITIGITFCVGPAVHEKTRKLKLI